MMVMPLIVITFTCFPYICSLCIIVYFWCVPCEAKGLYVFSLESTNSKSLTQGMYICGAEREQDKMYVSSWVSPGVGHSRPAVELISCHSEYKTKDKSNNRNSRRKQRPSIGRYATLNACFER